MKSELGGISRYLLPVTSWHMSLVIPNENHASGFEPQCDEDLMPPNGVETVTKRMSVSSASSRSGRSVIIARRATRPPWLWPMTVMSGCCS